MHFANLVVGLSMNSLAAQAFVFFGAGFETSSTTMTFCLYELSLHQDIQERVREEIDHVLQKHDGKITYEAIQEMEYLDKVVSGEAQFRKFKYLEIKVCSHDQYCNHFDATDYN
jgi:cytochrome P450 family 6